jgi:hypothetical protein
MTQFSRPERLHKTKEFEQWWESQGRANALQNLLDPDAAKLLAWEAWRVGRERMSEATASQRLQLARG